MIACDTTYGISESIIYGTSDHTEMGICTASASTTALNVPATNVKSSYNDRIIIVDKQVPGYISAYVPEEPKHHPIKITDCPKCNSNLPLRETDDNGICKCEFCGKEVYVW